MPRRKVIWLKLNFISYTNNKVSSALNRTAVRHHSAMLTYLSEVLALQCILNVKILFWT